MGSPTAALILVCAALLQRAAHADPSSCNGVDGLPGGAGLPGLPGLPGFKGERGKPAVAGNLQTLKGEKGSQGSQGPIGRKGYLGSVGEEGPVGTAGDMGIGDDIIKQVLSMTYQSAFSVVRTLNTYPPNNQKLVFQKAITNKPGDFNLITGTFTCRVPGVYYFVFNAFSRVSMCLRLNSEAVSNLPLRFCDYNSRGTTQVLSGGVVLQLTKDQHVWMEGFADSQLPSVYTDTQDKLISFNGFLLFPIT
ncbi:hypothetical protein NHX12_030290 [Muraenolepis orangiensis]|uniref:C1q domain-containing protein n=1 Tax=Muraenolepis orangiensis TaxID=630683 RepID=A0A9Q0EDM9_9TELE|nr:hypothetical protein NHX12_030290 [Muraenolepis orangiensis]